MAFTTKKKAARIAMFIGTVGISAALVAAGVSVTGAYFSDTKSGTITGTIGSIKVSGGGDLAFTNLLPGEAQTVSGEYQNIGRSAQDVWLVFNNADALHALNNLGSFGEVHIGSNSTEIFASTNLNDNLPPASGTCGPFTPAGCWPVPARLKLADNVSPAAGGSFSFSFKYPSKLGNTSNIDTPTPAWNSYPLGAPINNGLPYQIVATQVGIVPNQAP